MITTVNDKRTYRTGNALVDIFFDPVFYKQFMQDQEFVKHMVTEKMNEMRQTKFVNE